MIDLDIDDYDDEPREREREMKIGLGKEFPLRKCVQKLGGISKNSGSS